MEVRLYSGSILISQFFGLSIYLAICGLAFLTFTYTLIGGFKAVVRTDLLQTLVFIAGGICAHIMIPEFSEKSWSEMMAIGFESGKMFSFELSYVWIILIGILGGVVFDIATHGVDQDFCSKTFGK